MKVRAIYHRVAEPSLREWSLRLSDPRGGDPAYALFMREEILRKLEETKGMPEGAILRRDLDPPRWIWQFSEGAWVHFRIHDDSDYLGFRRTRDIVIIRVSDRPPT